jgi:hypothetical protein
METNSPSKPRRAPKACSFCRRRKVSNLSKFLASRANANSFVAITEGRALTAKHIHKNALTYLDRRDRGASSAILLRSSLTSCRPTNARLSRLEAENEQLRRHLGRLNAPSEEHRESSGSPSHQRRQTSPRPDISNSSSVDRSQSAVSRIFISPNGDSSYHGLTSTLFDDAPTDRHGHPRSADPQVPVEHIRKQLMGESAYQSELVLVCPRLLLSPNTKKGN